jgi:hypothetical protein
LTKLIPEVKIQKVQYRDIDEPSHPVGWKDNVEEVTISTAELQDEEACESCTI